jgi:N-carbamoyl-L-amino-acid hydrolase
MADIVREPARKAAGLIRAHPELAGKAMVSKTLTGRVDQRAEQGRPHRLHAGGIRAHPAAQRRLQREVRLSLHPGGARPARHRPEPAQIIETFARRLQNHPDFERAEALRNIHRIAELRLNDKFGAEPTLGNLVWDWQRSWRSTATRATLGKGQLTVTYLTDAHRACAEADRADMRECGFDEVNIDAVGNVVGVYRAAIPAGAKRLLTGSHYDTVRNGGKYDGRLGIFVPMACVRELRAPAPRCPSASRWSASPKRKASATRPPSSARAR